MDTKVIKNAVVGLLVCKLLTQPTQRPGVLVVKVFKSASDFSGYQTLPSLLTRHKLVECQVSTFPR